MFSVSFIDFRISGLFWYRCKLLVHVLPIDWILTQRGLQLANLETFQQWRVQTAANVRDPAQMLRGFCAMSCSIRVDDYVISFFRIFFTHQVVYLYTHAFGFFIHSMEVWSRLYWNIMCHRFPWKSLLPFLAECIIPMNLSQYMYQFGHSRNNSTSLDCPKDAFFRQLVVYNESVLMQMG